MDHLEAQEPGYVKLSLHVTLPAGDKLSAHINVTINDVLQTQNGGTTLSFRISPTAKMRIQANTEKNLTWWTLTNCSSELSPEGLFHAAKNLELVFLAAVGLVSIGQPSLLISLYVEKYLFFTFTTESSHHTHHSHLITIAMGEELAIEACFRGALGRPFDAVSDSIWLSYWLSENGVVGVLQEGASWFLLKCLREGTLVMWVYDRDASAVHEYLGVLCQGLPELSAGVVVEAASYLAALYWSMGISLLVAALVGAKLTGIKFPSHLKELFGRDYN